jgi:hydrogenase maturation factor
VSGARPRWFVATTLFRPDTTIAEVESTFPCLTAELDGIGVALVGGTPK